jgi:hypothetical protein
VFGNERVILRLQPIPYPRLGVNVGSSGRIGLELVAQITDVNLQDVQIIVAFPPYLTQELPVGEYFASMDNKRSENIIFSWRELSLLAIHHNQTIREVNCQVAKRKNRLGGSGGLVS